MSLAITNPELLMHLCQAEWRIALRGPDGQLIGHFTPIVSSLDEPGSFEVKTTAIVEQLRRVDKIVEVIDPAGRELGQFEPLACKRLRKDDCGRGLRARGRRARDIIADLERRYAT